MRFFHASGRAVEPGLEHRFGAAGDHVQQPCRSGPVPGRGEVDDDGDVLVAAPGMPPYVLVHADHGNTIEAGRVIDQQALALGQNRVVRGVPGHAQPGSDPRRSRDGRPRAREVPTASHRSGELRPPRGRGRRILSPAVPAVITPVTTDPQQQRRGPVAERLVSQTTGRSEPRDGRSWPPQASAPRILGGVWPAFRAPHRSPGDAAGRYSDQAQSPPGAQKVVRSGSKKGSAWPRRGLSDGEREELPSSEDLDVYPGSDSPCPGITGLHILLRRAT
jgi:hypothetical protein